jgi:mRNA interferase RelE/StbE
LSWRRRRNANSIASTRGRRAEYCFLAERLAHHPDPREHGEALRGERFGEFWKYRVGDYRIIARIEDGLLRVLVVRIGHRCEVYR